MTADVDSSCHSDLKSPKISAVFSPSFPQISFHHDTATVFVLFIYTFQPVLWTNDPTKQFFIFKFLECFHQKRWHRTKSKKHFYSTQKYHASTRPSTSAKSPKYSGKHNVSSVAMFLIHRSIIRSIFTNKNNGIGICILFA